MKLRDSKVLVLTFHHLQKHGSFEKKAYLDYRHFMLMENSKLGREVINTNPQAFGDSDPQGLYL